MHARPIALLVALTILGCAGAEDRGGSSALHRRARRAIVVTVDGLMPETYTAADRHRLAVPTLRAMVARGAWARGARPVMPTVTYPTHTTLATGVDPGVHGITGNRVFDPLEKNREGWHWYSESIRVPALWDAVEESGRAAALINWPVTVGARARFLVPEYWRAGTAEDQKLLRALSTPGLLQRVEARFPDLWRKLTPPDVADEASIDVAVHLIESAAPHLVMIHIWMVDEQQHLHGPWSAQARSAIETADRQLARLIEACKRRGVWEETALFVVSDHGFTTAHTEVRLAAILAEQGLITRGTDGKPTAWRAAVQSNGGSAYIYLADPRDRAAAAAVRAALSGDPAVRRILDPDAIRALGGDPDAALAIEAADGFTFGDGAAGPIRRPVTSIGQHGHPPDREAMQASFLAHGPGIRTAELGRVRLIDVAPTVAAWLGIALPRATGRPIDLFASDP